MRWVDVEQGQSEPGGEVVCIWRTLHPSGCATMPYEKRWAAIGRSLHTLNSRAALITDRKETGIQLRPGETGEND
jgi:hypothetical protein